MESDARKTCRECKQSRALIAFYKNRSVPSGYEARCKLCYNKSIQRYANTLNREEKPCSRCKVVKPLADFHRSSSTRDGRGAYCKPCAMENNREYREKNPLVKIRSRLTSRLFRATEDPEVRRKKRREYYAVHKEQILKAAKLRKHRREKMQQVPTNS